MYQIVCVLVLEISVSVILPMLHGKMNRRARSKIIAMLLIIYICGNLYCTVFSRQPGFESKVDLRPFKAYSELVASVEIKDTVVNKSLFTTFMSGTEPIHVLILNILLYYPLGYLLPILFPKLKPKHVILIGWLCSIATEATQYLLKMGWCETDDVIHNTLGTAIGVWVWHLQSKRLSKPKSTELPKD